MPGVTTLAAEVTNISAHGFSVLLGDEELPVPYARFPWFKKATVEQILGVERPTENHLCWPELDVDLSVESLREPDAFPLMSRGRRLTRSSGSPLAAQLGPSRASPVTGPSRVKPLRRRRPPGSSEHRGGQPERQATASSSRK